MKLAGIKTVVSTSARGTAVDTGALLPNAWYEIKAVAAADSVLPIEKEGAVFKTPDTTGTPITIIAESGDEVYPLTLSQLCKTTADISFSEGIIDVTDDYSNGFIENILDGYKTMSGNLGGFARFDDATQELVTGSKEIFKRFINVVTDDGEGVYTITAAENEKFLLFMCLNKGAIAGQVQNWIIVPVLLNSLGTGAGLKDGQKRDLAWTKGEGYTSLYQRTAFADDILS